MEFLIRDAVAEDFSMVYSLFEQLWPNKELNRNELRNVYDRGVISATDQLFCATIDGEIIGFCAYAIVNNLWQAGYIAYIYAMVIDEKYRGKGFGSQMIMEVIKSSKLQGIKRVELDSGFPREKAHQFYEQLGFEKRAFLFSYEL